MKQFFSFNDDNGILFHDTAEEAKAAALADLDAYRDYAKHDGEWPGDVEGVRWGQVLGMTRWKKISSDPESFEYELEDVQPNNKKEQPHKAAGSGLVQSLTTSQESVGGLRELYGDAYGETPPAPQEKPQQQPLTDDQIREEAERKAGYWQAFTHAVATRGAALARVKDRRGRDCWECTVGRSTVQRLSAESAISGALWLEFDGNIPEGYGLPESTLRRLVSANT